MREQLINDLTEVKNILLAAQKKMYDIGYDNPHNDVNKSNNKAIADLSLEIAGLKRGDYPFSVVNEEEE